MSNIEQVVSSTKTKKGSKKNPWAGKSLEDRKAHLKTFPSLEDKKAFYAAYRKEWGYKFLDGPSIPIKDRKEKLKDKNLEVIKEKLKDKKPRTGKFLNIDYNEASPVEQKGIREKARDGMFKVIDPYLAKKVINKHKKGRAEVMENFKTFMNTTYNSQAVSDVENLFTGKGARKEAWDLFMQDFKLYLAE